MSKTLCTSLFNIAPVSRRRHLSDPATIPRHHEQAHIPHKAYASQDTVDRQIAARFQPRRDAKIDRKGQRIPDQYASCDHLARQLRVAGDGVSQSRRDSDCPVESHGHLRDGQRKPVQVVCHPETIQDHCEWHEEDTCDEDVEGVFRLGDAVVSSRQAESEDLADFANVEATVKTLRVSKSSAVDHNPECLSVISQRGDLSGCIK